MLKDRKRANRGGDWQRQDDLKAGRDKIRLVAVKGFYSVASCERRKIPKMREEAVSQSLSERRGTKHRVIRKRARS